MSFENVSLSNFVYWPIFAPTSKITSSEALLLTQGKIFAKLEISPLESIL